MWLSAPVKSNAPKLGDLVSVSRNKITMPSLSMLLLLNTIHFAGFSWIPILVIMFDPFLADSAELSWLWRMNLVHSWCVSESENIFSFRYFILIHGFGSQWGVSLGTLNNVLVRTDLLSSSGRLIALQTFVTFWVKLCRYQCPSGYISDGWWRWWWSGNPAWVLCRQVTLHNTPNREEWSSCTFCHSPGSSWCSNRRWWNVFSKRSGCHTITLSIDSSGWWRPREGY